MRVIPVLDLAGGRAVHARGGARERYQPVRSRLAALPGDALALGRAFQETLGLAEWYVADLDAIGGGVPQGPLLRSLAALGGRLAVDAGTTSAGGARAVLAAGAARVVVGLETLPDFGALDAIRAAVGAVQVAFSLDLRAGVPLVRPGARHGGSPLELADRAVAAGVRTLIVIDVGRVGAEAGVDLELVAELRSRHADVELWVGGGVRGLEDLRALAAAGGDGALVASALHDGRLGARELAALGSRRADHPTDSR